MPLTKECDCIKIRRLFDAAIDGELSPREERKLDAHLTYCEFCRTEYEERKKLSQTISLTSPEVPSALHSAVMSRIHEEGRPKHAPVFSRPKMALVGSLCVLALVVGIAFSPAFLGIGMKDAANAAPEATGGLGPYGQTQDKTDNLVQSPEDESPSTEATSSIMFDTVYSVADADWIVRFFGDGTATVLDEQNNPHKATYKLTEKGLVTITFGQKKALFAIDNTQLWLKDGELFD